jgi:hypothetical protein
VYEVPLSLGFTYGRGELRAGPTYTAELHFMDELLLDKSTRTLDPSEADLFLVPFLSIYGQASNRFADRARLELVLNWLAATHPYWNATGGTDHVVWITGDRGACGLQDLPLFAHGAPIFVHHLGLLGPWTRMYQVANNEPPFDMLDVLAMNSSALAALLERGEWCYVRGRSPRSTPVSMPSRDLALEWCGVDRRRTRTLSHRHMSRPRALQPLHAPLLLPWPLLLRQA